MSQFEEGPKDAKICFLGEAPSFEEVRKGRPFVGPAGNLFERCLHSAQIVRAASYVTNVFENSGQEIQH